MSDKLGGPAFPTQIDNHAHLGTQGMSLRDYFAAKAMQALVARTKDEPRNVAFEAYEFANAMLEERRHK